MSVSFLEQQRLLAGMARSVRDILKSRERDMPFSQREPDTLKVAVRSAALN